MQKNNIDILSDMQTCRDKIRGSLFAGAVGDALGYPVEFMKEKSIFHRYGKQGITSYELDSRGKALISDDTQMTLFTAEGLLTADACGKVQGVSDELRKYVSKSYQDWLYTQEAAWKKEKRKGRNSWLLEVPELYAWRAPGNTCLNALRYPVDTDDYIRAHVNSSKGCGGIMRVAPLALNYKTENMKLLDMEGAQLAAITHGHSLGYMTAAVLVHVIHRIVFSPETGKMALKEIVIEARNTVAEIFFGDEHLEELVCMIDKAIVLSENENSDLENIHRLGEGWVAEETLGISLYCALKYQDDFSAGIIASVNHNGDSDSTGAVTGNILGAIAGYEAIEEKWKQNLELSDVILKIADDLCRDNRISEES